MRVHRLTGVVVLVASVAQAAGFQIDLGGARGMGMANAVAALTDDATSLFFNPAGIAGRQGFQASAGISLILPGVSFRSDNTGLTTSTNPSTSTPFNVHASWGIVKEVAIGVSVYTPFGAGASWPADWEGAGLALGSTVQTFNINPSIAFAFNDRFRVAIGFQAMRGIVLIERGLDFIDAQGKVSLGGDAWGYGVNAGLQVEMIEDVLSLGATYRSGVAMNFRGRAHFSDIPLSFQALLKDQPITANVYMPDTGSLGLGITPVPELRFGLQANFTLWNTFRDLTISFEDPALTNPLPKEWSAVVSIAAGAEWQPIPLVAVRLGYAWDPTPSPGTTLTPDLPDATRHRLSVGGGLNFPFGLSVDVAYQAVLLEPKRSTAPGFSGTYSGAAHVLGLNVGYRL